MQERRRYTRWVISQPVKFKKENSDLEFACDCRDISSQGISLEANQQLPPDTPIRMKIDLEDQGRVSVRGKVVWQETPGDNSTSFLTGINFVTINDFDKDRIFNYMFSHAREQIVSSWWK